MADNSIKDPGERDGEGRHASIEPKDGNFLAFSSKIKLIESARLEGEKHDGSLATSFFGRECCIYRVEEKFHELNHRAYIPDMVSIGPFHHGKGNLPAMEQYKLIYLRNLLTRITTTTTEWSSILKEWVESLKNIEEEVCKCYSEPINLNSDEFIEMLLVDGLFIIELFRKKAGEVKIDKDDPLFDNTTCNLSTLVHDLVLLENQLPMLVLNHLFNLPKLRNELHDSSNITTLALIFFDPLMPRDRKVLIEKYSVYEGKHLLDLLYKTFLNPLPRPFETENNSWKSIPSATELKRAVRFKKGSTKGSFLDIKFIDGVLEVPPIIIQDQSATLLRNLIAFEQYSGRYDTYMTSYATLMKSIISSAGDVRFLRNQGIIKDYLGNDEDFSNIFIELSCGVNTHGNFYYSELCDQVNTHYEKTLWHVWGATLKPRDYLCKYVAALVVLVFALIMGRFFNSSISRKGSFIGGPIFMACVLSGLVVVIFALLAFRMTNKVWSLIRTGENTVERESTPRGEIPPFPLGVPSNVDGETDSFDSDILWEDLTIGKAIEKGPNGIVHRGLWRGLDVAVEVFPESVHLEDLQAFKQEVSRMKRLRHPNVVIFMGAVTSYQHPCIVTEFIHRGSLFQFFQCNTHFDWRRRILMALDIARGMNYLHHCNPPIFHPDLKPSNLFVDKDLTLKVGNFGFSRLRLGHGTVAPEFFSGMTLLDEKSNVFSYGVILWELTMHKLALRDRETSEIIRLLSLEIPKDTDPQWVFIMESCWHSNPECRPTFEELLEMLKDYQRQYNDQDQVLVEIYHPTKLFRQEQRLKQVPKPVFKENPMNDLNICLLESSTVNDEAQDVKSTKIDVLQDDYEQHSRPSITMNQEKKLTMINEEESPNNQVDFKSTEINGTEGQNTAALKLQKAYKGYRTRRNLSDCAVVVDELRWQAIDFARLSHSTISFFNFGKPETAASRWNRISLNASKVGKGLTKDAKAKKLAFQHWIEAVINKRLFGFFYWLDVEDGREVDLEECPRSKLRQQRIKYLGPQEREHYEYIVVEGILVHIQTREPMDTTKGSQGAKWIFVMSPYMKLYAGEKKKGVFHYSSFLAGGATLAAGRLVAENGVLKSISASSGHYRPTDENFGSFLDFLKENGVHLNEVQVCSSTGDSDSYDGKSVQTGNAFGVSRNPEPSQLRSSTDDSDSYGGKSVQTGEPSQLRFFTDDSDSYGGKSVQTGNAFGVSRNPEPSQLRSSTDDSDSYDGKSVQTGNEFGVSGNPEPSQLEIPKDEVEKNSQPFEPTDVPPQTDSKGTCRRILSGDLQSPGAEVPKRINSKKSARSYQLGHLLTLNWSLVGRIANYPMEQRLQSLEFVKLSPTTSSTPFSIRYLYKLFRA